MTSTPCVEAVLTVLTLQVQPGCKPGTSLRAPQSCHPSEEEPWMGFKLMTLHILNCYDVEDKAEKPLTLRRIGASFLALNRENVATNLTFGTWTTRSGHDPHHPSHGYTYYTKTNTGQAHRAFFTRSRETLNRTLVMKR